MDLAADRNLVRCFHDKVIAVVLQNNNLIGELPQEILKLVHLQELDLHKNQLTGTIPSSIGKLKELKVLNLSFNRLTGTTQFVILVN
jgi:Leucine-rich repeat (LRR) protein